MKCPGCERALNASLDLEAGDLATPAPGVITVCVFCGAVLEFGPELELALVDVAALPDYVREPLARAIADLVEARNAVERQIGGAL